MLVNIIGRQSLEQPNAKGHTVTVGVKDRTGKIAWGTGANVGEATDNAKANCRLFAGVYPGGIVFADRWIDADGDYKRVAFLPYETLEIKWAADAPKELKPLVMDHAAELQAKRGEQYRISTCGQTVTLGN